MASIPPGSPARHPLSPEEDQDLVDDVAKAQQDLATSFESRIRSVSYEGTILCSLEDYEVFWLCKFAESLFVQHIDTSRQLYLSDFLPALVKGTHGAFPNEVMGIPIETTGVRGRGNAFTVRCQLDIEKHETEGDYLVVHVVDNSATKRFVEDAMTERSTVTGAGVAMVAIDDKGIIQIVNKNAETVFEQPSADLVGQNISMCMPEPYRARHHKYLDRYMKTGEARVLDKAIQVFAVTKTGRKFPISLMVSKSVLLDKVGFVGVIVDISDKVKEEQKLAAEQQQIAAVLDAVPDALIVIDDVGKILSANISCLRLFNYEAEDLIGENIKIVVPEPYKSNHDDFLRKYSATGVRKVIGMPQELSGETRFGDCIPIRLFIQEIHVGGQVKYVGVLKDIAEEKAQLSAIEKNQSMMKGFLDNAVDGIITITEYGAVDGFNPSAEAIFGYSMSEVLGRNVSMLMPMPFSQEHDTYLSNYRQTGVRKAIGKPLEVSAKRKNGTVLPIELSVSEIMVSSKRFYSAILRDISATRMQEENMKQSQERVNTVVESMTDAVIAINQFGTITTFNSAAEECFETTKEDCIGNNIKMLMPEPYHSNHDGYLADYITTGVRKIIGRDTNVTGVRLKSGDTFSLQLTVTETVMASARFFIGVGRDMSELFGKDAEINAVMDSVPDGIITISGDGTITAINKAIEDQFAVTREMLLGANISSLMPEPYSLEHDQYLERYLTTHEAKILGTPQQLSAKRYDGTIFPISLYVTECIVGGITSFTGLLTDYSENFKKRAEIERNMQKTRAVLDNAPDAIISISEYGIIEDINNMGSKLFGYGVSEMIGRNIKTLMPAPYDSGHDSYLENYRKTGVRKVIGIGREVPCKRRDGSTFVGELAVSELSVASSRSFAGTLRDISERKLHLEKMEDAERFAQTIVNAIPDIVVSIDINGIVIGFNKAAEKVFGYAREEVLNGNVTALMPEPYKSNHPNFLSNYETSGVKNVIGRKTMVEVQVSSGEKYPVQLTVSEVNIHSSRVFIGIMRDVQEAVGKDEEISAITDSVPDGIVTINMQGFIIAVNKATCTMFGMKEEQMVNAKVNILMPEPYRTEHDSYLENYESTGQRKILDIPQELAAQRADGTVFAVSLFVTQCEISGNISFTGLITDATEKKKAQETLEKNNARTRGLFEMSPDGIITISDHGIIQDVNSAACEAFGYSPTEMVGRNVKVLMPLPYTDEHDQYLENYRQTGVRKIIGYGRELPCRRKDGSRFIGELSVCEINVGSTVVFTGLVRDVSERKVHLEKMKETENFSLTVVNSIPNAIITIDEEGSIVTYNKFSKDMFGYDEEAMMGKNVAMIMPPPHSLDHNRYLTNYLRTGRASRIGVISIVSAQNSSGDVFPVELAVTEIDMGKGARNFLGVLRDVSTTYGRRDLTKAVMDSVPDGMLMINMMGKILSCNKALVEMFGYDKYLGCNVEMLMPEPYKSEHASYLKSYRDSRKARILGEKQTLSAQKADLTIFPVTLWVTEANVNGEPVFTGLIHDTTRETIAKEKADKQMKKMRGVLESSADAIILADEFGVIMEVNPRFEEVFGYQFSEVKGQNVSMLMPPEIAAEHDSYLSRYKNTGVRHVIGDRVNVNALSASGDELAVELRVSELLTGNSQTCYSAIVRDRTPLIKAQAAMENSSERNALVLNSMVDAVITIDIKGRILSFNDAATRITGFAMDEVHNQNVKLLMPERVAVLHDQYLANYQRTKVKKVIGKYNDLQAVRKGGEVYHVRLSVTEAMVDGVQFFIGLLRDVSENLYNDRRLRAIMDSVSDAVLVLNDHGYILDCNKACEELFEYPADRMINGNIRMLMPEPYRSMHDSFLERYKETGEKKVIGKNQKLTGMKRNDVTFPISLLVSEARVSGEVLYIGMVHDSQKDINSGQEIVKAERRLNALLNTTTNAVIVIDVNGIIENANHMAINLFGFAEWKDAVGNNVSKLMPQPHQREHDRYLQKYLRTGQAKVIGQKRRMQAQRVGGEQFHIYLRVCEFMIRSNRLFAGVITDASDYVTAKEMAASAIKRKNAFLESHPDAIIRIDQNGIIIACNKNVENIFGYKDTELMGKNVKILAPPPYRDNHDSYLKRYERSREARTVGRVNTFTGIRKNGGIISLSVTLSVCEVDKKLVFTGVVRDYSQVQNVKQNLADIRETVESIINTAGEALIVIDDHGVVEFFNKSASQIFEYGIHELVGQNIDILIPDPHRLKHKEYLSQCNRAFSVIVTKGLRSDQSEVNVRLDVNRNVMDGKVFYTAVVQELVTNNQTNNQQVDVLTEKNLKVTLNKTSEGVVAISQEGIIAHFNQGAEMILGYSEKQVVGKNVSIIIPPEHADRHDDYLRSYMAKRVQMQCPPSNIIDVWNKMRAVTSTGQVIPVCVKVTEVFSGDKNQFFAIITDDSHSRELEDRVLMSERQCKLVAHGCNVPIVVSNGVGKIISVNREVLELFGYESRDQLVGFSINMLMPPEVAAEHDAFLSRHMMLGEGNFMKQSLTVTARRSNGQTMKLDINLAESISSEIHMFAAVMKPVTSAVNSFGGVRANLQSATLLPRPIVDAPSRPTKSKSKNKKDKASKSFKI